MKTRESIAACVALLSALLASPNSLADLSLQIVDIANNPVPGAVIVAGKAPFVSKLANDEGITVGTSASGAMVDQVNKRFEPFVSVVRPGSEVHFPNNDDTRHHVYSFSEGNRFERKLFRSNEAEPVRFETPGIVALGCNIHDNMQAYVMVTDSALFVSDSNGQVTVGGNPQAIRVWHPLLESRELSFDVDELQQLSPDTHLVPLSITWRDPQAARSRGELEQLLKQFSDDAL